MHATRHLVLAYSLEDIRFLHTPWKIFAMLALSFSMSLFILSLSILSLYSLAHSLEDRRDACVWLSATVCVWGEGGMRARERERDRQTDRQTVLRVGSDRLCVSFHRRELERESEGGGWVGEGVV